MCSFENMVKIFFNLDEDLMDNFFEKYDLEFYLC